MKTVSRRTLIQALSCSIMVAAAGVWMNTAQATAAVGKPAPALSLTDVNGKTVNLADFKGKHVVLEWHNPNCPFVVKHYKSGNMQAQQKKAASQNVVWLAVNSTHPEHQDFMTSDKLREYVKTSDAAPTAYLLDKAGEAGRAYGAKTTPHMFIIDPQGKVIYEGGIDDKRSTNPDDIKSSKQFVVAALDDIKGGKPVTVANSAPYGCSVKYTK